MTMDSSLTDLAPLTRFLRAKASSNILVSAVHHLGVFELLAKTPLSISDLQKKLQLRDRPAMVLVPALRAMELIVLNDDEKLELTALGNFLSTGCDANIIGYLGLEKDDAGVLKMSEWLKHDGPKEKEKDKGFSYVKDNDAASPMDEPEAARFFTMALAGRARYLSPIVARVMTRSSGHLLDVAGGTGYYTFEWLAANKDATATILDTPEVLKVAEDILQTFRSGAEMSDIRNRVTFLPGDMLHDELPKADIVLAASLFHDWAEDTCEVLARKFAGALKSGGELWVHDTFLDDDLDGPLAATDYSAMLFLSTKGRCYSRAEYRRWLTAAGLIPVDAYTPTLMDYGLISARKT